MEIREIKAGRRRSSRKAKKRRLRSDRIDCRRDTRWQFIGTFYHVPTFTASSAGAELHDAATRSGDPLDLGERDRRAVKPKARRDEGWAFSFPRNPRKQWSTESER